MTEESDKQQTTQAANGKTPEQVKQQIDRKIKEQKIKAFTTELEKRITELNAAEKIHIDKQQSVKEYMDENRELFI